MTQFQFEPGLNTKSLETLSQLKKLQEENLTLRQENEMFQEEIQQKTDALLKSTKDYSTLKSQYEELLLRVTELHIENQSKQTPFITPTQSPQSDNSDLVVDLQNKLKEAKRKKDSYHIKMNEYLATIRNLEKEITHLKNSKKKQQALPQPNMSMWESTFNSFVGIVSPYFSPWNHPIHQFDNINDQYSYILDATLSIVDELKDQKECQIKYDKLKNKYDKLLNKCQDMAQNVANNQALLENALNSQKKKHYQSQLDQELSKMHKFLRRYEKECNDFSQTVPCSFKKHSYY